MFKNVYKDDDMRRNEHLSVRNAVGWYRFTHLLLEVSGKDATAFLDAMLPKPFANLAVGSARYTTVLNDDGLIRDDVVVFRMEENLYWISTLLLRRTKTWFDAHTEGYDVEFKDITTSWEMYSVQGPRSKDMLNSLLDTTLDGQKFFTIRDNSLGGLPVKVARAGFTGEKFGYEVYVAAGEAQKVYDALTEAGKAFDAVELHDYPIFVWALPTECGMYLMCDLDRSNPMEVGLDKGIDWNKDFVGKEALLKAKEAGITRQLVGFTTDEYDVHLQPRNLGGPGTPVMFNGENVGYVTKFTYSYVKDINIGFAVVDTTKVNIGDRVKLNGYDATLTEKVFI